jgi:hypothetical protein
LFAASILAESALTQAIGDTIERTIDKPAIAEVIFLVKLLIEFYKLENKIFLFFLKSQKKK